MQGSANSIPGSSSQMDNNSKDLDLWVAFNSNIKFTTTNLKVSTFFKTKTVLF